MSSSIRPIQSNIYDVYDNSGSRVQNPSRAIITTGSMPASGTQGDIYFDASGNAYWYKNAIAGWINFNYSTPEVQIGQSTPASGTTGLIYLNSALNSQVWYNGSSWKNIAIATAATSNTAYTPVTTNLKGWFSAKDISGTNFTNVSGNKIMVSWPNKSPNKDTGSDMTFEAATAPAAAAYLLTDGSGYQYLKFNPTISSSNRSTAKRSFALLNSGTPPHTPNFAIFLVYSLNTNIFEYDPLINIRKDTVATTDMFRIYRNNSKYYLLNVNKIDSFSGSIYTAYISNFALNSNDALQIGKKNVLAFISSNNGTQWSIFNNGILMNVVRNVSPAPQFMYMNQIIFGGDVISSSNNASGHNVYELLVYYTDITDSERQKIEGYLAWNNGVANNLYAGHPYKNAAPTV